MTSRPKVLYVDHKNNGSVLFLKEWEQELEVTHVMTVLSAINIMGCKQFDFIVAEWTPGHRSGLRIIEQATKLGVPCALYTDNPYSVMNSQCNVWSKESVCSIPQMIKSALFNPNQMIVDSNIMRAEPPLKTKIFNILTKTKQHG